jgi:lipopolysaccharide export LptBFGC system permease protein LptF
MTIKEYTEQLVKIQGKTDAFRMMKACLEHSKGLGQVTYFDEADFAINNSGHWELNKTQSSKRAGNKERRVNSNINFYKSVLIELGKIK